MAPVGQSVTGSGIIDQAMALAALLSGNNLTARGQDVSMRGQDISLILGQAQFEQAGQQALQEYYNNVAQFGLDKARGIYEQRLASAQMNLTAAATGGQQRQARADTKLQALQMLADRKGPQNWVGYDYLLGKLGTPTGQAVDPTTFADDIVDPRFEQGSDYDWSGKLGDESLFNDLQGPQQAARGSFPTGSAREVAPWLSSLGAAGGGGGGGQTTAAFTPPPAGYQAPDPKYNTIFGVPPTPAANITGQDPATDIFSGVRDQDVADLTSGRGKLVNTGTGGTSRGGDYTNFQVFEPGSMRQYGANDEIAAGVPVWLKRLNKGGPVKDKMAIVGEGATAEDLGTNGELLINWTGAPFDVVSNKDARAMLAHMDEQDMGQDEAEESIEMEGYSVGTRKPKPSFLSKLKSYGSGTLMVDGNGSYTGGGVITPAMTALMASKGLPTSGLRYTADGQIHYQEPDGGWSAVHFGLPGVADGSESYRASGNDPQYAAARARNGPGARARTAAAMGQPAYSAAAARVTDFTQNPLFGQSAGVASQGGAGSQSGDGSQTTVLNADGSYGMPENDLHIKYSPETIGNSPFLQNLKRGQRQGGTFGSFGASLSNDRLGIKDAPTNINLQGWRDSDESQQLAVKDTYESGLATSFGDIFNRAKKAAPAGVSTGAKRYGG